MRLGVEAQGVAAGGVGHAVGDAVVGAVGLDAGVALRAAAGGLDPHLGKHTRVHLRYLSAITNKQVV